MLETHFVWREGTLKLFFANLFHDDVIGSLGEFGVLDQIMFFVGAEIKVFTFVQVYLVAQPNLLQQKSSQYLFPTTIQFFK